VLRKVEPGGFLELNNVFTFLDVESIVAIAVRGCLRDLSAIHIQQADADPADAALARFLDSIPILIVPDAVAEDQIRLWKRLRPDFAIATQRDLWFRSLAMKYSEIAGGALGDEIFEYERRERHPCLRSGRGREM
jgi:hypothetical protein